jgi:hypothetical protein
MVNLRGNLISVIGIPLSAIELIRGYFLGSSRFKRFAELDAANIAAMNGRPDRADILYERLLSRIKVSAGLHYNRAKVRYDGDDWSGALEETLAALKDCSHHIPAIELACRSLVRLGRLDEAESFRARHTRIVGFDSP